MDILVLILLALFIIIIALMVIIYVIVRRNMVERKFDKELVLDEYDEDDDFEMEGSNLNIIMPISFKEKLEEEKEELPNEDIQIIEPVVIETNEKIEEVVNVLIDKRNYIFLANDNIVSKNDYIKLVLDGKVYFGVVTKANYKRDISQLNVRPRKLNIIKIIEKNDHKEEKNNNNNIQPINIEYVPIKKKKI